MLQASLVVFERQSFKSQVGSYLILSNFILTDLKVSVLITGSKTKKLAVIPEGDVTQAYTSFRVKIFLSHRISSISFVRACADCFSTPTPSEVSSFILASSDFRKDQILHQKRRYLGGLSHEGNVR